jgi:hypothetical protein
MKPHAAVDEMKLGLYLQKVVEISIEDEVFGL